MFLNKTFLTVDFEAINAHGRWVAYGAVVSLYPSGQVIAQLKGACVRKPEEYDEHTSQFWEQSDHKDTLQALTLNANTDPEVEEKKLCTFVREQLDKYPDVVMLQDNPQFDCAILNDMMSRNNMMPVSSRLMNNKRKYRSTICSKSFRSGVAVLFGGQETLAYNIASHQRSCNPSRDIDTLATGPKHNPICDAAQTQSQFFAMMDFVHSSHH